MYVGNDARKMEIQYNSRMETEMSVTSLQAGDFRLMISDLIEVEYWITGKKADNHINKCRFYPK
jgi:hypothetical protein